MGALGAGGAETGVSGAGGQSGIRRPDKAPPRKESILAGGINDQEAREDSLGFAPYVDALAAFLANPATKPPLTISIEGQWGTGKSSFMRQLAKRITDAERSLLTGHGSFKFWFNPWRHDKQEALWAAFALEFLTKVREALPRHSRWQSDLRFFCSRFAWRSGWTDLVRTCLQCVWWVLVVLTLAVLSWKSPSYLRAFRES